VRKWAFFSFFIFLLTGIRLSAQNPYIQHYTTFDGLPSNTVYYVYQDSKKFIWFATDAGVSRFDGSTFTNYRKKDGLNCNEIIRIKEDSTGRIWFFNLNATLNYFWQNKIFNEANATFLKDIRGREFFLDFFQENSNILYFYNKQAEIFILDKDNKVKKINLSSRLKSDFPGCGRELNEKVGEDVGLRYISKTSSGGILAWTRHGLFSFSDLSGEPAQKHIQYCLTWIFHSKQEDFFAIELTDDKNIIFRLLKFSDGQIKESHTEPAITLKSDIFTSILEDSKGYLWISKFASGLFCIRNDSVVRHFDIREPQSLLEDHENNIWITSMTEGVYRISPYINSHLHYETGSFGNKGITALCKDIVKGIWCTNGSAIYLFRNGTFYMLDNPYKIGSINLIHHLKNNKLITGAKGSSSCFFNDVKIIPEDDKILFSSSFWDKRNSFYTIAFDITGEKGCSFGYRSLFFFTSEKLFADVKEADIRERIYNVFYNSSNDLVVNAGRNYLFFNDSLVPCKALSVFDNRIIMGHKIMNENTDLFNLEGDSIFIMNNSKLYNLTKAFEYPIDLQIKHMVYLEPVLFIATKRNIYICNNPLNILENKPVRLNPVDIGFRNINDMAFTENTLYIASDDGLTGIPYPDINGIKINSPIPYFRSVQINDKEDVVNKQKIALSGQNRINIVYGSINYSLSPVIYSYKLEGTDNEWKTGTGTNVVYQDLPKGDYIFRLKVRKSTSSWSKPIEYRITIKATFWQHPLFLVFLSLLFTGLIARIIIRRKNIQIKRRELDNQLITLEQKALQSMMNPHFIFNSLGSIQNYLLQKKSGEAGVYLSQFARLIRQNLNSINVSSINLEEEIDRLKNYLDLEKMRMDNKFEYHIDVGENVDADEIQIPSMIIQPYVENAIWHGISSIEFKGEITIKFRMPDEKSLMVLIEDNGIGMKRSEEFSQKSDKHFHLGMEMTRKRLEILGKKFSVKTSIEFSEPFPGRVNPGTRVEIVVPVGL
jgi:two-component sensor histidine kinase